MATAAAFTAHAGVASLLLRSTLQQQQQHTGEEDKAAVAAVQAMTLRELVQHVASSAPAVSTDSPSSFTAAPPPLATEAAGAARTASSSSSSARQLFAAASLSPRASPATSASSASFLGPATSGANSAAGGAAAAGAAAAAHSMQTVGHAAAYFALLEPSDLEYDHVISAEMSKQVARTLKMNERLAAHAQAVAAMQAERRLRQQQQQQQHEPMEPEQQQRQQRSGPERRWGAGGQSRSRSAKDLPFVGVAATATAASQQQLAQQGRTSAALAAASPPGATPRTARGGGDGASPAFSSSSSSLPPPPSAPASTSAQLSGEASFARRPASSMPISPFTSPRPQRPARPSYPTDRQSPFFSVTTATTQTLIQNLTSQSASPVLALESPRSSVSSSDPRASSFPHPASSSASSAFPPSRSRLASNGPSPVPTLPLDLLTPQQSSPWDEARRPHTAAAASALSTPSSPTPHTANSNTLTVGASAATPTAALLQGLEQLSSSEHTSWGVRSLASLASRGAAAAASAAGSLSPRGTAAVHGGTAGTSPRLPYREAVQQAVQQAVQAGSCSTGDGTTGSSRGSTPALPRGSTADRRLGGSTDGGQVPPGRGSMSGQPSPRQYGGAATVVRRCSATDDAGPRSPRAAGGARQVHDKTTLEVVGTARAGIDEGAYPASDAVVWIGGVGLRGAVARDATSPAHRSCGGGSRSSGGLGWGAGGLQGCGPKRRSFEAPPRRGESDEPEEGLSGNLSLGWLGKGATQRAQNRR